MAGKSTLMRATTVAALLANVGLLAPVDGGTVPRYTSYFVRTASFDVPAEGKSAFAQAAHGPHATHAVHATCVTHARDACT